MVMPGFMLDGIAESSGVSFASESAGRNTTSAWSDLAMNLISAAGSIGVAALEKKAVNTSSISSNLAGRLSVTAPGGAANASLVALTQQQQQASRNKMILVVGGVGLALALVLAFALKR